MNQIPDLLLYILRRRADASGDWGRAAQLRECWPETHILGNVALKASCEVHGACDDAA